MFRMVFSALMSIMLERHEAELSYEGLKYAYALVTSKLGV
jgi:hypothetical protein